MDAANTRAFLALGLGLALGAGGMALVGSPGERRPVDSREHEPTVNARPEPAAATLAPAARVEAPTDDATPRAGNERLPAQAEPGSSEGPLSAALRAYAATEIARGWREARSEEIPAEDARELLVEFETQVLALPFALGARAAREKTEGEVRANGLDLARPELWLSTLDERAPELRELARDPQRFESLFTPRAAASAVDGTALREGDALAPGAVVQFPAGVFAVADLARGRDPFPSDLIVRGAGMNATLLVLDQLNPREALERFTLEDCTVFTTNCGAVSTSRGANTLTLRRVRLTGFDCGAGGSYALYLRSAAILAVGCRFESGYGRNPGGYANLLRQSGPLVARFEGCTFERVDLAGAVRPGVVFSRCTMTELLDEPGEGPLYEACSITVMEPELRWNAEHRTRDLDLLFPGWEARLERR